MSSEVCPYCGKLYKRLKSHLPYCKAAPSVKNSSGQQDAAANQTTAAAFPPQKTKKTLKLGTESTSSSLLTPSSKSSAKKKKEEQALHEQIQTSTSVSKPKKKSLRDLIEAAVSQQSAGNLLENDRDESKSALTDSWLSSQTGTKAEKDSVKSAPKKKLKKKALESEPAQENEQKAPKRSNFWEEENDRDEFKSTFADSHLSSQTGTKAEKDSVKSALKKKLKKKALEPESTQENEQKAPKRSNFWEEENVIDDSKSTLTDSWLSSQTGTKAEKDSVKSAPKKKLKKKALESEPTQENKQKAPKRSHFWEEENDRDESKSTFMDSHLSSQTGTKAEKDSVKSAPKKKLKKKALESEPTQENKQKDPKRSNLWEENTEDVPVWGVHKGGADVQQGRISLQSVRATLGRPNVPQQPSNSSSILSQIKATDGFHGNIPPPQTETSQPSQSKQTNSIKDASHAAPQRHVTGTFTTSPPLSQSSSYRHSPVVIQSLPVDLEKLLRQSHSEGALTQLSLGEVTLRELPDWLVCKRPRHPRDIASTVQRGWQWYYKKYINVKKGGVSGVGMLLAGCCTLGYIWCYPRIKLDRWRKYH